MAKLHVPPVVRRPRRHDVRVLRPEARIQACRRTESINQHMPKMIHTTGAHLPAWGCVVAEGRIWKRKVTRIKPRPNVNSPPPEPDTAAALRDVGTGGAEHPAKGLPAVLGRGDQPRAEALGALLVVLEAEPACTLVFVEGGWWRVNCGPGPPTSRRLWSTQHRAPEHRQATATPTATNCRSGAATPRKSGCR